MKSVDVHGAETAEDFVAHIRDRGTWGNHDAPIHDWIFRGQANSDWDLMPTGFRMDEWAPFWNITDHRVTDADDRAQRLREIDIVKEFVDRSDRAGLYVPEAADWLALSPPRIVDAAGPFPPQALLPGIALARHHGIPARLLDWTEDALVAAFLAAADAERIREKAEASGSEEVLPKSIAVWTLRVGGVRVARQDPVSRDERVEVFRLPWGPNQNLRAQRGRFTIRRLDDLNPDAAIEPLDATILRLSGGTPDVLRKVTLPMEKVGYLLSILRQEGVDAAAAFPSYDGVTATLKESRFIRSLAFGED